jgi:arylsulfatase
MSFGLFMVCRFILYYFSIVFLLASSWGILSASTPNRSILPIPPEPYTNLIGPSYRNSKPQIQSPLQTPVGAPNILLILLDDAGYGQTSTFGAPIPTPALDRLASGGLRFTRFHVTSLCSPSRAALLTGRNSHAVGMGIVTRYTTGFPGYDGSMPKSAAFISEMLRQNGYATAAFGKWHLIPEWETGPNGPFDHWPTSQGFDYFYGFLHGEADQWHPILHEGTKMRSMDIPVGRESDYTLTENLADKTITWINQQKSIDPNRPFFAYFAPGGTHAPLQAPKNWIEKFKGKFDLGWDRYRELVFVRQKELGVIPPDTVLTPRPAGLPSWDTLTSDQKKIAARLMEVFAGLMAQTDHEIGRIVDAVAATGQLDDTLIIYIAGDNGASLQGDMEGKFSIQATDNGAQETTADLLNRLEEIGSESSSPQYSTGWAWAGNTPFQWGKQFASHLGGTRDPLVIHWPNRIKKTGGIRHQYHHLIDIAPTLLEAARLPVPALVNGVTQQPIHGVSMLYTFDDAGAPERHKTQYYETFANRSIYHEGWLAGARSGRVPWIKQGEFDFEKQPWELYNLTTDYSQSNDLAAEQPQRLALMQKLFESEAQRYNVLPLDPRSNARIDPSLRTSVSAKRNRSVYYGSGLHLYDGQAPAVRNTSHLITADIIVGQTGSDGVLVAAGGNQGGYSLFVQNRKLHYTYNFAGLEQTRISASENLPLGPVTVSMRFNYDGGGRGKGGNAILSINGEIVAQKHIPRTAPNIFSWYETFDIGEDLGATVDNYPRLFTFQGIIKQVSIEVFPEPKAKPALPISVEVNRVQKSP